MTHLKALTFTANKPSHTDPTLVRRQRLIERLEEQRLLAKDPTYAPIVRRWKKDDSGVRVPLDTYRRVKPWWRRDGEGGLFLVLKKGLRTIEIEKGKAGIVVGPADRLDGVLSTLIAATQAGELDEVLEAASAKPQKAKRASKLTA